MAVLLVGPAHADDDEKSPPPPQHTRAPRNVSLEITEPVRVIAPGEEHVEGLAQADPGRFRQEDDHWVDALGEFVWDEEEEIYWQLLDPQTLTRGRQDFVQFCASCHGLEGDGYGRSARHLRPPPRSFLQSTFKFTKVPSEYLPSDEALVHLIRSGLDGTPMLPWDVSEQRLHDIVQYIKTLSPEEEGWRDPVNEIGDVVETGEDPWVGREKEAIEQGQRMYHMVQCYSCHPAYVAPKTLNELRGLADDTEYPDDLTYSKLKTDSSYEVLGYQVAIPAPDFTWHTMRSGRTVRDIFQTIAAGIGGAGMPTWKDAMPDETLWAISYYVKHLADTYKDQPARAAFMAGLRNGS
jgi:mono/diheme cytochrome c family protein